MTTSSSLHSLTIAQLAIYTLLAIPTLFILWKHSLPGLLAWIYIFIFCSLRIIASALSLHKGGDNETAAILTSIGLSPLLLGVRGLLFEGRSYIHHLSTPSTWNRKLETIKIILFHLLVTTGLALLASGSSSFTTSSNAEDINKKKTLAKVGIVILFISWTILSIETLISIFHLFSCQRRQKTTTDSDTKTYSYGKKMLFTVGLSLSCLLIRVLYSFIAILAPRKGLNPVSPAFGMRLGLSFFMELGVVLFCLVVGIWTRDVRGVQREERREMGNGVGVEDGRNGKVVV